MFGPAPEQKRQPGGYSYEDMRFANIPRVQPAFSHRFGQEPPTEMFSDRLTGKQVTQEQVDSFGGMQALLTPSQRSSVLERDRAGFHKMRNLQDKAAQKNMSGRGDSGGLPAVALPDYLAGIRAENKTRQDKINSGELVRDPNQRDRGPPRYITGGGGYEPGGGSVGFKPQTPGFLGGGDDRFSPIASSGDISITGRPSVDNTGKFMDNVTGKIVDRPQSDPMVYQGTVPSMPGDQGHMTVGRPMPHRPQPMLQPIMTGGPSGREQGGMGIQTNMQDFNRPSNMFKPNPYSAPPQMGGGFGGQMGGGMGGGQGMGQFMQFMQQMMQMFQQIQGGGGRGMGGGFQGQSQFMPQQQQYGQYQPQRNQYQQNQFMPQQQQFGQRMAPTARLMTQGPASMMQPQRMSNQFNPNNAFGGY